MELVYKLPCLQYKLSFVFFVFTNNNKDQSGWTDTTHNDMLVWNLWFTIATLVLRLCPQGLVVIDHKSLATMHYLLHIITNVQLKH